MCMDWRTGALFCNLSQLAIGLVVFSFELEIIVRGDDLFSELSSSLTPSWRNHELISGYEEYT